MIYKIVLVQSGIWYGNCSSIQSDLIKSNPSIIQSGLVVNRSSIQYPYFRNDYHYHYHYRYYYLPTYYH